MAGLNCRAGYATADVVDVNLMQVTPYREILDGVRTKTTVDLFRNSSFSKILPQVYCYRSLTIERFWKKLSIA